MFVGKRLWKPLLQLAVTGHAGGFVMQPQMPQRPGALVSPGLYLHVPFCKNLCPYCPYNRVEYSEPLFAKYERAVKQEIDLYAPYLADNQFASLYIGGGTPTVNWPGLIGTLRHLKDRLGSVGNICIELHPANMDTDCLVALKEIGVTMLSIGVETTDDGLLRRIVTSTASREISPAARCGAG